MACSNCNCKPCQCSTDSCSCLYPSNTNCVYWRGSSLSCEDVTIAEQGDTLTDILTNLTDLACGNIAPSGYSYTVSSCNSNIIVTTTNPTASQTNYEVCLNGSITSQINENTTDIAELFTCCDESVKTIESLDGSIAVTNLGSGVYNLTAPTPSSITFDGIVYSNNTQASLPTGAGTTVTVRSYTGNFSLNSQIATGDEIIVRGYGKVKANGSGVTDEIIFNLGSTAGTLSTTTARSFNSSGISSYFIEARITVTDVAGQTAFMTVEATCNSSDLGTTNSVNNNTIKICESITNLDYSNVILFFQQNNLSLLNRTNDNWFQLMTVEVRKRIV